MRQQPKKVDIDDRKEHLREVMAVDSARTVEFWEKLDLSWLFHECALEGVVVTNEEVTAALRPAGIQVAEVSKSLFLHDIRRTRDANDLAKEEAKNSRFKITLPLLKRLYETITGGEAGRGVMEYRRDMPLHRTYFHDIVHPPRIIPDLTKLLEYVQTPEYLELHPLQQVAVFHHRLMGVFPFTDLSGRVGRLVMNIQLIRNGYLPAVIHGIDRQRYYESLKQPPAALQRVVTEAVEHATDHAFKFYALAEAPKRRAGNF